MGKGGRARGLWNRGARQAPPARCRGPVAVIALLLAGLADPSAGAARQVTVGLARPVGSLDPHVRNSDADRTVAFHRFDPLIRRGPDLRLRPGLAHAWWQDDETRWMIRLREDVRFHDGSPLISADVVASLDRARAGSARGYGWLLASIVSVTAVEAHMVEIRTRRPDPLLADRLSQVAILSARVARGQEIGDGPGIGGAGGWPGTGPYRVVEHKPDDFLRLVANPGHWAGPPPAANVTLRFVPDIDQRLDGLRDGSLHLIDGVSLDAAATLMADPAITLIRHPGNRLVYLHLDSARPRSPFVTAADGGVLARNPLRNPLVRRALSLALDREALARMVMAGAARPASQVMPLLVVNAAANTLPAHDPEAARRLLQRAGVPPGLAITLHVPVGRYPRGVALARAAGRMFDAIGVRTRVAPQPSGLFFAAANQQDYSLMLLGWSVQSTELHQILTQLVHTRNPGAGVGLANRGGYSDPVLDTLLDIAGVTAHPARRATLLRAAAELVRRDAAIIPILFPDHLWAARPGTRFTPRTDGLTLLTE